MTINTLASCGLDCEICSFKKDDKCNGCNAQKGEIFWGKCDLYECASKKSIKNCGECEEFPCLTLKEWAKDEGVERIDNLKSIKNKK